MGILTTADGAPLLRGANPEKATLSPYRGVVRRSVTINRDLDGVVVARMKAQGLSYSGVLDEALRALLATQVA